MSNALNARQEMARRELARRKLLHFVRLTYPNYTAGVIHRDLCERLERFSKAVIAKQSPRLMVLMPPRHGKALSDDTLVPTMAGFRPHGSLTTNDVLIGSDGKPLKILAVAPPVDDINLRVHFRSGDYVDCHANHDWGVFYRPRPNAPKTYKVVSAGEMHAHFREIGAWLSNGVTKTRSASPYAPRFFMPEPQARNMPYPLQQMWIKRPKPPLTLENYITFVEDIPPVSGRCIQVDSPDGLYCVTTSMLLTHNSELVSIRFPAWHMGHRPDHEFIVSGYALELPMKFSRKAREILRDPVYKAVFPDSVLATDSQSVESWNTTLGGGYRSASVTGGLTGHGAAILVIDDPFKNLEEADSAQIRDKVWDWYQSAAYTRLAPGGGVLCVQCMTGDTPVLMADGTEKRLDRVQVGDAVATYDDGALATSTVLKHRSNGRDCTFTMTMKSGKIVRANARHPFLAYDDNGELRWTQIQNLRLTQRIVALKGAGESGPGRLASGRGAINPSAVGGTATATTIKRNGRPGTGPRLTPIPAIASGTLSIGTGSPSKSMRSSLLSRAVNALSVSSRLLTRTLALIGITSSASTIATRRVKYGDSYATTAILPQATQRPPKSLKPSPSTSNFTTDEIESIVRSGWEEVFDVQIDRTENFIANGLVSHNTRWSDDDLAGRLLQAQLDPEMDQWEVVSYPAISDHYEYVDASTLNMHRHSTPLTPTPPSADYPDTHLFRAPGESLHPERFPIEMLKRIRSNLQPRIWSALYQQNPIPDEGLYFKKEWFRTHPSFPQYETCRIITAWDFAIGEKQQNDWTVGVTLLQDHNDVLYLLDVVRFKGDTFMILQEILRVIKKYRLPLCVTPPADYVLGLEDGQIFKTLRPLLEAELIAERLPTTLNVLPTLTDKMARARSLQAYLQRGRFVLPPAAGYDFVSPFVNELLRFPGGAHDDQIDAAAHAVRLAVDHRPIPRKNTAPRLESWRDRLKELTRTTGTSHMSA